MPRIRTIKPEMASDVGLAKLSRDARYTFVLLITQADDQGFLLGNTRQLLGSLYPHDEDVSEAMLKGWVDELIASGMVRDRRTNDGAAVLELTNWSKHQKVDRPQKSILKNMVVPCDSRDTREDVASHSRDTREDVASHSRGCREDVASHSRTDLRTLGPLDHTTKDLGPTPARKHEPSSETANGAEDVSRSVSSLTASQVAELTNAYSVDQGHIQTWARLGYRFDEVTLACVSIQSHREKHDGQSPSNIHRYGLRVMQENRANPQRAAPDTRPTEPKTFTFTPEQIKQQMDRLNEHLRPFAPENMPT